MLNKTLQGDRLQIAIFGKRNAGKSSVINAITGQDIAIVSEVKGTTTDPVSKAMEILPLGPCMFIDTPGLDDKGKLGEKRIAKTKQVLNKTDIALVVIDISLLNDKDLNSRHGMSEDEEEIIALIEDKELPYIIVLNKSDRIDTKKAEEIKDNLITKNPDITVNIISALKETGIDELKDSIITLVPNINQKLNIVGDLIEENDIVVLVVPIDTAAPKGRLIIPQQQVIRDLLDNNAIAIVTQPPELESTLNRINSDIKMVITDSQVFKEVSKIVPKNIPLTSFSILFARHKGNLKKLVEGVSAVNKLKDKDKVLIAEGCTHRRQCDDIGTVKIPQWLKKYSGKDLEIQNCSGVSFPTDLSPYPLIIHCGGCTLNEKEMKYRINCANKQGVPIVNYGIFIAYVNGILKRSVELFPQIMELL